MYHQFRELPPTAIKARGFLAEFLRRQRDGLTGHHAVQGYPFDTVMWKGRIENVHLTEGWHHGKTIPVVRDMAWWPYEQSGYLLDGLIRLGLLLDDPELQREYRENLDYLISHPRDGRLGRDYHDSGSEWPLAVFFKSVIAWYEATGDERVREAFHRHYRELSVDDLALEMRHFTNLEGVLKLSEWTGDEALKAKAVAACARHNAYHPRLDNPYEELWLDKAASGKRVVMHGVTFSEELKIPVLLYLYTGDRAGLEAAERCLEKAMREHGQVVGLPSANEFLTGRDPLQGYETCVISDLLWSVGYFLQATGKAGYADQLEKIAFNALPGSITKDFTRLQYLSSPNQVLATPFSNHSHFMRGENAWRQYKANHIPECCGGNLHRVMPNYVLRMFLADASGAPVAATYGPAELRYRYAGVNYRIVEETEYPFEPEIRFRFELETALEMPFTFRIPGWCRGAKARLNGEPLTLTADTGTYSTIRRLWRPGDELVLELPAEVELQRDRQWGCLSCGPLVFSYPVPHSATTEGEGRFAPLTLMPAGPWNYALDLTGEELKALRPERRDSSYPYDQPPLTLRVPVRRITNYDELALGRYTPELPLFYHLLGDREYLELVPYGCTTTRITAFPDPVERQLLPVVNAAAAGPYPYDFRRPLAEQSYEPEIRSDEEFYRHAAPVQVNPDDYYDLIHHFQEGEHHLAYLQLRIWAEEAGPATLALGVAGCAIGYLNGEKVLELEPVQEAELTAPLWFDLNLRQGYNYLRLKLAAPPRPPQYRRDWGARAVVFRQARS